ncbi:hypothetical protein CKA32_004781 [Geitlerinema sp. FC II]|nr:hypothetical protein [Geitlerinema sp. CS-897]PPT07654.1 hypothetical protein CKA32_004781 [Geitlerinema sp. FC II]
MNRFQQLQKYWILGFISITVRGTYFVRNASAEFSENIRKVTSIESLKLAQVDLSRDCPEIELNEDSYTIRFLQNTFRNGIGTWNPFFGVESQVGCYRLNGNEQGQVTLRDIESEEVVWMFQMEERIPIRHVFLLDGGRTAAAAQKDRTVFWDLETGREIYRLNERVYGFPEDRTKFLSVAYRSQEIDVYAYPDFRRICRLEHTTPKVGGIQGLIFSPNGQFVVIGLSSYRPLSDESYSGSHGYYRGIASIKLFDLDRCQEVSEFNRLRIGGAGEFSSDSQYYEVFRDEVIEVENRRFKRGQRFNLETYEVEPVILEIESRS